MHVLPPTQPTSATPPLVLASASPRRRQLLQEAGIALVVDAAGVDEETALPGETPAAHVERLALAKADAVTARHPDQLVLGADTVVVLDGVDLRQARRSGGRRPACSGSCRDASRVIPARLRAERPGGGETELLLVRPLGDGSWEVMARPAKRLHPGWH